MEGKYWKCLRSRRAGQCVDTDFFHVEAVVAEKNTVRGKQDGVPAVAPRQADLLDALHISGAVNDELVRLAVSHRESAGRCLLDGDSIGDEFNVYRSVDLSG